ncbi:12439_t:CDS:2 [Entrophospora sp. SA101]|nr:12439_t:CDS:2 [Entrophospora sp. SA101]
MGNKLSSIVVVNKGNDSSSCQHIKKYLDSDGWCKQCSLKNNKWTSGNFHVDEFIMKTQKKSCKWTDSFLEWIPFENFQNLKKIGDGHFSTVYCATWMDGKRIKSTNKSVCARSAPITVALKSIKNSANISEKYVQESLIKEICENHKRPNLLESTPSKFKDLALHCTDPNPYARPPARLLSYIFSNWWQVVEQSQDYEIRHQFNSSDKFIKNMEDVKLDHDFNAIYTSRYFNFNNDDDYSSIDKNNEMFHADINNNLESKYLLDLSVSP